MDSGPAPRSTSIYPAPKIHLLAGLSTFERNHLLAGNSLVLETLPGAEVHLHRCDSTDGDAWEHSLRSIRPEVLICGWMTPTPPAGYFDEPDCPVRYICFLTGSVRRLVPRAFIERGGLVSNWGDDVAPMVAEHALLLLLASLRRLPEWRRYLATPINQRPAQPMPVATRTLYGRTVNIHGFGRIARQVIRLLAPFDVKIRVFSAGVPPDFIRAHGADHVASMVELFTGAEILIECEALTPQTRGAVDRNLINLLSTGAVFVNVGRGLVVDEEALIQRAAAGEIHLALDVATVEPIPPDSPLCRLSDAIISPHVAGPTHDRLPDLGSRALSNLNLYLSGKQPADLISPDIYDRST